MQKKTAIFPGSFDPFTTGHASIVERATALFDKVIIAIGHNTTKNSLLSTGERKALIKKIYNTTPGVEVVIFDSLTVTLCEEKEAGFIIRGLRSTIDFEYEKIIAMNNLLMQPDIETIFLMAKPAYTSINSSIIREIIHNNGSIQGMVPDAILPEIENLKKNSK